MSPRAADRRRTTAPRALTLAEAAVSTVIVGVLLVAALQTVGAVKTSAARTQDRDRGVLLAQELMSEILQQAYQEPTDAPLFGPEPPESSASRAVYDDVDDYNGWDASPPQDKAGAVRAELAGWRQTVAVAWVAAGDLTTATGKETGLKRIVVTVTHNDLPVATLTAVKSQAAATFSPNPR